MRWKKPAGYATLRTSRTAAAVDSPTHVTVVATAVAILAATAAVLALYFTHTTPFATSSSSPSPLSSSTGVGSTQLVYATDVVIPTTGSFLWHVNTIGGFVPGDVITLTCSSAPGFVVVRADRGRGGHAGSHGPRRRDARPV